jgi:hypothetical protein
VTEQLSGKRIKQRRGSWLMMNKNLKIALLLFALPVLAGCGESPDVEKMKAGLAKTGMPADQAACFAEKMSETVDGEQYNYMSALMNEGVSEKDAVNKTRRKYSADFKTPMEKARAACVK